MRVGPEKNQHCLARQQPQGAFIVSAGNAGLIFSKGSRRATSTGDGESTYPRAREATRNTGKGLSEFRGSMSATLSGFFHMSPLQLSGFHFFSNHCPHFSSRRPVRL